MAPPAPARATATDSTTLAAFAVLVLIAGSNFVAVRFSNQELPPFWGAALRFGLAAALLAVLVAARRAAWPRGPALRGAVAFGVLAFGVSYALAYWALVEAPAALASVLMAVVPLLTLLLAVGAGLEKLSARAVAGGLVAALGVGVVFREQLGGPVPAAALLALVAMSFMVAASNVVAKRTPRGDPFAFNGVAMASGTVVLFALALLAREPMALPTQPAPTAAVAYLVVASIVLFGLFLYVLQRWSASATSYQFVLMPIVTIVVASLLAGEPVTGSLLAGAALVAVGVYAGALAGRPRPQPAPPPQEAAGEPEG